MYWLLTFWIEKLHSLLRTELRNCFLVYRKVNNESKQKAHSLLRIFIFCHTLLIFIIVFFIIRRVDPSNAIDWQLHCFTEHYQHSRIIYWCLFSFYCKFTIKNGAYLDSFFTFLFFLIETYKYLFTFPHSFPTFFSQILSLFPPKQCGVEQTVRSKLENENRQIENGKDKMETSK